jgi:hypothetical protein
MRSRSSVGPLLIASLLVAAHPASALAQNVDGYVSAMVDLFPDVEFDRDENSTVTELRARLLLERRFEISERIRLTAAGFVDGLVGERSNGLEADAIVRPRELHLEARWDKADLRIGLSRVVWGRLDEFLPTDVVNPLDLARFFFEGRSEARIPVAMVRGRALPSDRLSIEGIFVPFFTRGRFDDLGEDSSPFNVVPDSTCALGAEPPCVFGCSIARATDC